MGGSGRGRTLFVEGAAFLSSHVFQGPQDVPRAGRLAGWLRRRRFTCKQRARSLRFTRVSGVPRRAEGWLAGWLRGRRFTCKQRARALRFTRISGSQDVPRAGWLAVCGNADLRVNRGHDHFDLHVFQGSQDVCREGGDADLRVNRGPQWCPSRRKKHCPPT